MGTAKVATRKSSSKSRSGTPKRRRKRKPRPAIDLTNKQRDHFNQRLNEIVVKLDTLIVEVDQLRVAINSCDRKLYRGWTRWVSPRLRAARLEKKLTLAEVSFALGFHHPQSYANYEYRKEFVSLDRVRLEKFAQLVDKPLAHFVGPFGSAVLRDPEPEHIAKRRKGNVKYHPRGPRKSSRSLETDAAERVAGALRDWEDSA